MSITDPRQVYFSSSIPIDSILGTFEGSFTAPAPSGGTQERTSYNISTGITESTFFQGIYSVDNGATWRDFSTHVLSGTIPEIVVFGISNANTFTIRADNYSFVGLTTYTVKYKLALIAKKGQGNITLQPTGSKTIFNSNLNYQKIFNDESTSLSIANGVNSRSTFAHNLGYIPKVRSFIEMSSPFRADLPAGMYETSLYALEAFSVGPAFDASTYATSGVYMSNSNSYVDLNNQSGVGTFTGTLYMRTYYDD